MLGTVMSRTKVCAPLRNEVTVTPAEANYLTFDEAAQHLGVTRWSIGRAVTSGDLTAVRVPGKGRDGAKRIPLDSYLAYLARSIVAAQCRKDRHMTDRQPASTLPDLHLFEDVAEKYRLSLLELKRGAYAGRYEHLHIGTKRYFTDEQLQAFFASRTVKVAKQDDGLDGVRARRARRKAKAAQPAAPRRTRNVA